jgi:hypothetical protein
MNLERSAGMLEGKCRMAKFAIAIGAPHAHSKSRMPAIARGEFL